LSPEAAYRLPRTVVPSHYDIVIVPDIENATFTGTVGIDVDVTEPTSLVVMNAIELVLDDAHITYDGLAHGAEISFDENLERATLVVAPELPIGPARVDISFTGILNDDLRGFYRSVYTTGDGVQKVIATTQFEATDARRAFPCWDQPDFKATFNVTLIVDKGLMAVSNAAEVSRELLDTDKVKVSFARTMKMSTYLVAFVVGELEATDSVDVEGIPLRIIARPGNMHLTSFALDAAAHALRFFAEYYDIPYPGEKLDMVAIPDFSFGAMENLGCITYRETALLVDPDKATQAEAERVADVIAHEIAHMWFGDLVTMKWWNGVWLNEAFATFAEMKCVDAYRPDWKRWLSFAQFRNMSQGIDGLKSTRPVEFTVESPAEANAMFDVLTYQKGSAVLRMLEQYLGEEDFRAGVTRYLKAHAYANAETADLWQALETQSDKPVGEIMDTWILQGGYPRVTVSAHDGGYRISQEQFRFLGQDDQTWKVPVLFRSSDGDGAVVVGDDPVYIDAGESLVLNAGGEGFYRVLYEGGLGGTAIDRLTELEPIERFAAISDTFANVLAGDAMAADFLSLVSYLTDEDEIDVWAIAIGGLGELERVASSDDRDAMREFVAELVSGKAAELGWQPVAGESDRTRALRGLLLQTLGVIAKDRATIEEARAVYLSGSATDAEVAEAALMITAANGDAADFDALISASDNADDPQTKIKYLRAATAIPDPRAAEKMIQRVLAGDIRSQDASWVLARLIGSRDTGARTWEMVTENWEAILASMPVLNVRRMLDLVQYRSEPEPAALIMRWLKEHPLPSGEKQVAQKMEQLQIRVALRERESHRIGDALS
jgi:puromycin-sensitive aminopeptidase